jgi:hypothetical protein
MFSPLETQTCAFAHKRSHIQSHLDQKPLLSSEALAVWRFPIRRWQLEGPDSLYRLFGPPLLGREIGGVPAAKLMRECGQGSFDEQAQSLVCDILGVSATRDQVVVDSQIPGHFPPR